MQLPDLKVCLICEGIRDETGGKAIMLGVFGAAPDVAIHGNIDIPIASLVFVVFGGGGVGTVELASEIIGPEGARIAPAEDRKKIRIKIPPEPGRIRLAFVYRNLRFPSFGEYSFQILHKNDLLRKWDFRVNPPESS